MPIIYEAILARTTNKLCPIWHTKDGNITNKGCQLEIYMENYFGSWFDRVGLLRLEQYPDSNNVYIYANNLQRVIAIAQSFITGDFLDCSIKVFYRTDMDKGKLGPIFDVVITDDSAEFK